MTYNRRTFLQKSATSLAALSTLAVTGPVFAGGGKAAEVVEMGRAKLLVSRLGFGVGDGRAQYFKNMGQEPFTKLIRHALDRGVRYFDMDPSHMHGMMAQALKGVDRASYTLITGCRPKPEEMTAFIDRYRKELDTDCVDGVLITAIGKPGWAEDYKAVRDALSEAKEKGHIRACGVSVHGLEGMKTLVTDPWVDFAMISCNHRGVWMDGPDGQDLSEAERCQASMPVIKQIHDAGVGVVSMKTFGADGFENADERRKSLEFILRSGCVDAMPIHFDDTKELDETVAMMEGIG